MFHTDPRQYQYLTHQDNYPLRLKGNMKRKPTYSPATQKENNQHIKNVIANKIVYGNNLQNIRSHQKSILPQEQPKFKQTVHSKKIFHNQKITTGSGMAYLDYRSSLEMRKLPQRQHISQGPHQQKKIAERRHYPYLQNENPFYHYDTRRNSCYATIQTQTLKTKIKNDIHSNFERQQKQQQIKKIHPNDLFKKGRQVGLEQSKIYKMSYEKEVQMGGNDWSKANMIKRVNDKYRKSSLVIS